MLFVIYRSIILGSDWHSSIQYCLLLQCNGALEINSDFRFVSTKTGDEQTKHNTVQGLKV